MGIAPLMLPLALEKVRGQQLAPTALSPAKNPPQYPLNTRFDRAPELVLKG